MKKYITFINENIYDTLDTSFSNYLKEKNISYEYSDGGNMDLYINDDECIGTIRYIVDEGWVSMENIELKEKYRGKNIGFFIYESLFNSAKENNLKGLVSLSYSEEISQKEVNMQHIF